MSPPARVVWIEIVGDRVQFEELLSPPARVVWIEITAPRARQQHPRVATREGGVD